MARPRKIPRIEGNSEEDIKARLQQAMELRRTFFFEPYDWQKPVSDVIRSKNITAIISSNKLGKTCLVANIAFSWLIGFEPWTLCSECPGEGWMQVGGSWFRESSLGIKPPVKIILTGEDWKTHIGGTLVPELKKWFPVGTYETKCNEQGVEATWMIENGSVMTIMCYTQANDLFESFRIQGLIMDEPPPKEKFTAMSRGLLLDNGKILMSLTPLKEAWILDEIVLSDRRDVAVVKDLKITDNPDLYNSDVAVLQEMGLTEQQIVEYFKLQMYSNYDKRIPVQDKGYAAIKYLDTVALPEKHELMNKLKIMTFIKTIDPDDVGPRVFGQFKSLVGRVLKKFDSNIHVIEPFEVPTDWPVTVMIDFHLSTPQAVSYWAVDKRGFNYCIGETWENLSADGIADDIIRKMKGKSWRIMYAFIDPLSKGDTAYMRNIIGTDVRDTFSILATRLAQIGIQLNVATKDKDSGIKNIEEWLVSQNGMPTCFIFSTCTQHLFEVQRWVFDDDGKPKKENDHFMENWYRYTLTGAKYVEPWDDDYRTMGVYDFTKGYDPLNYGM